MSIYAVMETGGKQYRVSPGDIVQVEKLEGDVGSSLKLDRVLFVSKPNGDSSQVWLGKPVLSGASVQAEIVGQGRGEKILIIKMKRRKQYRRTQGHRQYYTQLLVTSVDNGSGEKASLDDASKKAKLAKFQSHLKAKGEAFTPKTLGSRKRMAAARAAGGKAEAAAPAKAKAKTAKAAGTKKASTAKKAKAE
jgi:large subunit ribosomal protein L21